eukprot:scaffold12532_cov53-Attheya_sp.AAC.1
MRGRMGHFLPKAKGHWSSSVVPAIGPSRRRVATHRPHRLLCHYRPPHCPRYHPRRVATAVVVVIVARCPVPYIPITRLSYHRLSLSRVRSTSCVYRSMCIVDRCSADGRSWVCCPSSSLLSRSHQDLIVWFFLLACWELERDVITRRMERQTRDGRKYRRKVRRTE